MQASSNTAQTFVKKYFSVKAYYFVEIEISIKIIKRYIQYSCNVFVSYFHSLLLMLTVEKIRIIL